MPASMGISSPARPKKYFLYHIRSYVHFFQTGLQSEFAKEFLRYTDYEIWILGIGIAALISVDIDVLGHCPPPSGSRRFFAEEKYSSRLRPALLRPARRIVHHRMPLRVNRMVIAVGDLIDPRAIAVPLELLGSRLPIGQGEANRIDYDPRSSARASHESHSI